MYEPKHTYEFAWDDFLDYGIAIANVSSPDTQNTFWIYFAKRRPGYREMRFMRKLEKKRGLYSLFPIESGAIRRGKAVYPRADESRSDWELEPWIENMTFTEKRINR